MNRAQYEIERLVDRRWRFIKKAAIAKAKAKADEMTAEAKKIEDELLIRGIKLTDSNNGTTWTRLIL